ncbi:hypothetical protein HU200_037249 [Digitaria exilis]|uniref:Uncharacterized protein n=1 Tax=Digitaria exilis TaxID=1010633 RepID=A0A835BRL9_9POAL|nr:hypothetical protein HU200_037249 [Digitaria exilis]
MKRTVVLYPGFGVGHVVPMAELAKVFLSHGYDVTMVIVPPPSAMGANNQVERIAAANPSISFHVLPPIPAPDFTGGSTNKHPFLCSIPRRRLHSLVIDMFCIDATDVATKLGVPVYTFVPTGASPLAVLTQLPALFASRQTGLKELGDTPLEFLGVPPMPASHLIRELLAHPEDETCKASVSIFERGMDTRGVLVNTFESLESRAVQALRDPLCVPGKSATTQGRVQKQSGMSPERSVVFLCFGSMGTSSDEQLKEMAVGLDKSGQRFLWVVRMPANIGDPMRILENQCEPDLDALLPEGFLERTKGRGLVVKSWAPQVEVLNHPATGAFVTHCGWNSILEGVMAGVPMLCWPLYAEQKMNKVFMTQDMGIGMEIEGYMTGFIKADEVEAKVRLVIESKEGRELKARVAARKKEAEAALEAGGSSHVAFLQFLLDVENLGDHQLADVGTSGPIGLSRAISASYHSRTLPPPSATEQSRGCSASVTEQRADPGSAPVPPSLPPSLFPTAPCFCCCSAAVSSMRVGDFVGGGVGHVVPMAELAKAFLRHGYDVTMVIPPPPFNQAERIAAANPSISFHVLPPIPAPDSAKHPILLMFQMVRQYNDKLESFLRSIPRQRLHSLVIDMFCIDAADVAAKLGVPVYTFYPSGASPLAVLTQLQALFANRQTGLKELGDTPLHFLGVPPMPASHLIVELLAHPEDEVIKATVSIYERGMDTWGVLVNTFESLESRAVQALRDPLRVPGKSATAQGMLERKRGMNACLGSMLSRSAAMGYTFSDEQLKEMAVGLDRSGQRFLWAMRMPANVDDPMRLLENQCEPDLDALLPEGFFERTKGRGLVVKSWAPQVEVLNHPATGAFVTHCGWNSIMEGVMAGVPMLCWPLYAEQKMNKVFVTEDMGVGMEIEGYMTGFVKADEAEAKVRLVMESEEGRALKARVAARKKEAEAALEAGGSSNAAFLQFLLDVENLEEQLAE